MSTNTHGNPASRDCSEVTKRQRITGGWQGKGGKALYGVYRWPKTDLDDTNKILIAKTETVEEAAYTADEAKELWGSEWAIGYKNLSMKGKQDERRKPG